MSKIKIIAARILLVFGILFAGSGALESVALKLLERLGL